MSLFRHSFVQIILLCHIDTYTYGLESKQEKKQQIIIRHNDEWIYKCVTKEHISWD